MSQKTIGDIYTDDPAVLPLDGTEKIELEQSAASAGALVSDIRARPTVAKSANYTITGREDAHVIAMTTGGSDRTVDLPNSASDDLEIGDEFELFKIDSGAGIAILARQGANTINGKTSFHLPQQYNYVRVRYFGSGFYGVIDFMAVYHTGWVANSDWTNKELVTTHGLNTPLSDLLVKFFISTDGAEANAFEILPTGFNTGFGAGDYGTTIFAIDNNSFKLQTGAAGIVYILDNSFMDVLDTESWYYKIKVYRIL